RSTQREEARHLVLRRVARHVFARPVQEPTDLAHRVPGRVVHQAFSDAERTVEIFGHELEVAARTLVRRSSALETARERLRVAAPQLPLKERDPRVVLARGGDVALEELDRLRR